MLRNDLADESRKEELDEILNEDWNHDSKGENKMSKDNLYESLFELADIWCPTADKKEY